MPIIQVKTNVALDDAKVMDTAKALSALASEMLGKPEDYVLSVLEGGTALTFGGSDAPAALVALESIGLPAGRASEFSATICSFLETALGIPAGRTYINFVDLKRNLVGWDGRTFG